MPLRQSQQTQSRATKFQFHSFDKKTSFLPSVLSSSSIHATKKHEKKTIVDKAAALAEFVACFN